MRRLRPTILITAPLLFLFSNACVRGHFAEGSGSVGGDASNPIRSSADSGSGSTSSTTTSGDPNGSSGTSDIGSAPIPVQTVNRQIRNRCLVSPLAGANAIVACHAVQPDAQGNEVVLQSLPAGDSVTWGQPVVQDGARIVSSNCSLLDGGLGQHCSLQLSGADPTHVAVSMTLNTPAQPASVDTQVVLLSFSVTVYGRESRVPRSFQNPGLTSSAGVPLLGYQGVSQDLLQVPFETLSSICQQRSRIVFVSAGFVFSLENGRIGLYAGTPGVPPTMMGSNQKVHRLNLGLKSTQAPSLACFPDSVLVSAKTAFGSVIYRIGADDMASKVYDSSADPGNSDLTIADMVGGPGNTAYLISGYRQILRFTVGDQNLTAVAGLYLPPGGACPPASQWQTALPQQACLSPLHLASGPDGALYFSDAYAQSVLKLTLPPSPDKPGALSLYAGPGPLAPHFNPNIVSCAPDGTLLATDGRLATIWRMTSPGTPPQSYLSTGLKLPTSLLVTAEGTLLIGDLGGPLGDKANNAFSVIWSGPYGSSPPALSLLAGETGPLPVNATPAPAAQAQLGAPRATAIDPLTGTIYLAEPQYGLVRAIDSAGMISTFAGGGLTHLTGTSSAPATTVYLGSITSIVTGPDGKLYIGSAPSGSTQGTIYSVTPAGQASVLLSSPVINPIALAVDSQGMVYFLSHETTGSGAQVLSISKISRDPSGTPIAQLVPGAGQLNVNSEGKPDQWVPSFALAADGSILYADFSGQRIGKIAGGVPWTAAGPDPVPSGTAAPLDTFSNPSVIAAGPNGIFYVYDSGNRRIDLLTPQLGGTRPYLVSTFWQALDADCGTGVLQGKATAGDLLSSLTAHLSSVCQATVTGIAARDLCGVNGTTVITVTTNYSPYLPGGNAIKIVRPCQ